MRTTLSEALTRYEAEGGNLLKRAGIDSASLEIGLALKRARIRAGITQHKLAELSGAPQSAISDIENGKGKDGPSYRTIRQLADALGVEIEIKTHEDETEASQRRLREFAKESALVLLQLATRTLADSLLRAMLDRVLTEKVETKARELLSKASRRPTIDSSAVWRLDAHETTDIALPEPTLYFIYEGPAEIKGAGRIARNVIVAAPNERVALTNTGAVSSSVLTIPLGDLEAAAS